MATGLGRVGAVAKASALAAIANFELNRYQDAQTGTLAALAALELAPDQEPGRWESVIAALGRGQPDDLPELLSEAVTVLAISTFRLADYPNALLYSSKEVHLKRLLGDEAGEALALHGMGWGYDKVGLYQKALEHHFRALEILERVAPERIASPLNGVAATYVNLGNYEQALAYSRRAIAIVEHQQHNRWPLSTALRCIGTIHQRLGDTEHARRAFEQSLAISDGYGRALNLLSLGEMAIELGEYDEALVHFEACIHNLDESTRKRSRAQALTGIGNVHLARGDWQQALRYHTEALAYARQIGSPVEAYRAHRGLAEGYKGLEDFERALTHFEAFHRDRERVLIEVSDIRSKVLMIQFDVEQLQKDQEIYRLRHVELAAANEELKLLNAQLHEQSNLDPLTGLNNRRFLDAKLGQEINRAQRYDHPLTLAMVDIDHFKRINDDFSHAVGDEVLKALADIFRANTREVDLLVRYGGEEVVIVFPDTPMTQAAAACEKVRLLVEHHPWATLAPGLSVTVSAGLAELGSDLRDDRAATLLAAADRNLYRAKRNGRNRVCF